MTSESEASKTFDELLFRELQQYGLSRLAKTNLRRLPNAD